MWIRPLLPPREAFHLNHLLPFPLILSSSNNVHSRISNIADIAEHTMLVHPARDQSIIDFSDCDPHVCSNPLLPLPIRRSCWAIRCVEIPLQALYCPICRTRNKVGCTAPISADRLAHTFEAASSILPARLTLQTCLIVRRPAFLAFWFHGAGL